MTELNEQSPLGEFPLGSHDSWQYHYYAPELSRFFSVRMWASGSVHQAWAWTAVKSGDEATAFTQSSIAHLEKCEFDHSEKQTTRASETGNDFQITFQELDNKTHAGVLTVASGSEPVLTISFKPGSVHFWHVPGQTDGVFHFPNISADITYEGRTVHAFGYCKRYWGDYDGPWGYQFIQGLPEDERMSIWTADATFGDDEYNYFKIYEPNKELVAAEKTDTWHNNQRAFWRPLEGPKMELELTPVAKTEFFLKSDKMYSKLVERFGLVELKRDGEVVFKGFGFNEICFGTVA